MPWSWPPISSLVTRSALSRPATRLYPVERREPFARTRGHVRFSVHDCDFCTICAHKCPTGAIVVNKRDKTWAIDHSLCILCGICVEECRRSCIKLSKEPCPPMVAKDVLHFRAGYEAPPAPPPAEVAAPEVPHKS